MIGADHVESGVSDADNPVRAKQPEILIATADKIVTMRMSRAGLCGRDERSGRGGIETKTMQKRRESTDTWNCLRYLPCNGEYYHLVDDGKIAVFINHVC